MLREFSFRIAFLLLSNSIHFSLQRQDRPNRHTRRCPLLSPCLFTHSVAFGGMFLLVCHPHQWLAFLSYQLQLLMWLWEFKSFYFLLLPFLFPSESSILVPLFFFHITFSLQCSKDCCQVFSPVFWNYFSSDIQSLMFLLASVEGKNCSLYRSHGRSLLRNGDHFHFKRNIFLELKNLFSYNFYFITS